jgi:hypothetical protein
LHHTEEGFVGRVRLKRLRAGHPPLVTQREHGMDG